jgi:hypothetical protein
VENLCVVFWLGQHVVSCEERKNQQDATIRRSLLTSVSKHVSGIIIAHLQENKDPVTAFGVLF